MKMRKRLRKKLGRGEFAPQGLAAAFARMALRGKRLGQSFADLIPILQQLEPALDRIERAVLLFLSKK